MEIDAYSPCPCGSGKKFKFCCQPIQGQITKVFQLDGQGQHEAALRMLEDLSAQHPDNPEIWGRKAQLLFQADKIDEAEKALDKALDLNPRYPFGYYLRGRFRQFEGELPGALTLFRKAVDYYDPEARATLGQLYFLIFDTELKLNHPVAARAALELARRFDPGNAELDQYREQIFGAKSRYPAIAREELRYQGPLPGAVSKANWEKVLGLAGTGRLSDAAAGFQELVAADPSDAPAWYNLALSQAWLGNNLAAVEALERYVNMESDENKATQAWALAHILLCGQGMEDHADFVEHSITVQVSDVRGFINFLGEIEKEGRLVGLQAREDQPVLTALVLEKLGPALTPELEAQQSPHLGAYFLLAGDVLRFWNVNQEYLEKVFEEFRQTLGSVLGPPHPGRGPAHFADLLVSALIFPVGLKDQGEAQRRINANLEKYFEETWIHRPLKSLGNISPLDAAGSKILRKKLAGLVHYLKECADLAQLSYDFNRLRRKLGLETTHEPRAPATGHQASETGAPGEIASLGPAELTSLKVESLSDDHLETAYQTALKLDTKELAGRFARALVSRPPRPDRPDRFPWHNFLIQQALIEKDTDAALDCLNLGEKDDCEHNEGRRRNDYEFRRGQVHVSRGEIDLARDLFDRLIERAPEEMRYPGTAAEAMLNARQPAHARRYAEHGLAQARKQQKRDSEEYFQELLGAAMKQGG